MSMNRMVASTRMIRVDLCLTFQRPTTTRRQIQELRDVPSCARERPCAAEKVAPLRTLDCIDSEASRRLAAPSDVPHRRIGALDVAPQSIRIEQRTCLAVAFESLPHR